MKKVKQFCKDHKKQIYKNYTIGVTIVAGISLVCIYCCERIIKENNLEKHFF